MLLFRSEEHVDRWCAQWRLPRGATMSLWQQWQLAVAWYGPDRRDPQWRRRSIDEVHALFESIGLQGPFWRLA